MNRAAPQWSYALEVYDGPTIDERRDTELERSGRTARFGRDGSRRGQHATVACPETKAAQAGERERKAEAGPQPKGLASLRRYAVLNGVAFTSLAAKRVRADALSY